MKPGGSILLLKLNKLTNVNQTYEQNVMQLSGHYNYLQIFSLMNFTAMFIEYKLPKYQNATNNKLLKAFIIKTLIIHNFYFLQKQ